MNYIQTLDEAFIIFVNGWHRPWLDSCMLFLSAKSTWIPLYVMIVGLFIKKYREKSWFYILLLVCCVAIADSVSSGMAKPFFQRLRPCYNTKLFLHMLSSCGGRYGFFSSHAANAFALTVFTTHHIQHKSMRYFMYLSAILVSLSRIYLAKHYFTDVFVGALFGTMVAYVIYCFSQSGIVKKFFRL